MFSSRIPKIPSIRRALPRQAPSLAPRAFPAAQPRTPSCPSSVRNYAFRHRDDPPRRAGRVLRYDPQRVHGAKPLITVEQLQNFGRSPQTKIIVVVIAGAGAIFYYSNLETVPVSGRRRFNCYSEASVEQEGQLLYQKIMMDAQQQGALVPSWDRRSKMVERVMQRLIPASGLEHVNWEVHVIRSNEKNAFVIPGGKVFVYSGILPICQNDDGLATVLSHEISHNLAQHQAEQMSSMVLFTPFRYLFTVIGASLGLYGLGQFLGDLALDLGFARPASRQQESEADYIGLMMMAKACYDPRAAVGLWQRMAQAQADEPPEWVSTHPSNETRVAQMMKWLDKAEEERMESGCATTFGYQRDFKTVIDSLGGGLGDAFWR
ncbi:hypothetical protein BP5796_02274 [Coleophoma crateriformis]|uniref:Peptidase M48 domain-containing protein n=1 Tax=Coleophoma crateriformis TaxID=565419 RepID=A0A3D8SXW9_9HELO|nr:hypothetical protein BP5796_02274 [Coleophoma crateriformis]